MSSEGAPEFIPEITEEQMKITPSARQQLAKLYRQVDDDEVEAIRIFVAGGGCSGMTYGMTFADRRTPYDMVLATDDFDIYVDSVAIHYLQGVEIDYEERPVGASFVFNNVFTSTGGTGTCGGCGAARGG
jgi:iron-sulfur cluster insertion protein